MDPTLATPAAPAIPGPLTLRRHLMAMVQAAIPSSERFAHDRWREASERTRAGSAFFHDLIEAIQGGALDLEAIIALAQFAAVESTKHEAECRAEARNQWQLVLDEYAVCRQLDPDRYYPEDQMTREGIVEAVLHESLLTPDTLLCEPPRVHSPRARKG